MTDTELNTLKNEYTKRQTRCDTLCSSRFSANLKKYLKNMRMTQKDLAKITDIQQSLISSYVKNEKLPSTDNLIRIANAMDISIDDLIGRQKIIRTKDTTKDVGDITQSILNLLSVACTEMDTVIIDKVKYPAIVFHNEIPEFSQFLNDFSEQYFIVSNGQATLNQWVSERTENIKGYKVNGKWTRK